MDLIQLTKEAINAALIAGKIIKEYMNEDHSVKLKAEPSSHAAQVVTEVDLKCENAIRDQLRSISERHDIAILSEETMDDGSRFAKEYFWSIDPLDGTLPFINKQPGFSVSIALVSNDGTPHIGIVYDPSTSNIYFAIKGKGAFKNNVPWAVENTNSFLTYVTDKKLEDTPNAEKIKVTLQHQLEQLQLGTIQEKSGAGSVMNGIYVLENGPACMMKLPKTEKGGGSLWDFAAIACIFHELGMPATNYAGGKLDLNKAEDSFMNHEGIRFSNLMLPKT